MSKRYLLAEIDDLADEFSEVDENGLHSERWCGIVDAKLIIMNAPSVSDRPQGEWIEKNVDDVKITVCSNCDKEPTFTHYYGSCGNYSLSDFCPNCGADMRGKDDE